MKKRKRREDYDILVWVDSDGDVVAAGYSEAAHRFFKEIDPTYTPSSVVEIVASPEDFLNEVPANLKVGAIHPKTKSCSEMKKNSLH